MESKKQENGWGGKRANSGRTGGKGISTKPMSLKLKKELYDTLVVLGVNKNKYINDAVSDKLKKEGYIK